MMRAPSGRWSRLGGEEDAAISGQDENLKEEQSGSPEAAPRIPFLTEEDCMDFFAVCFSLPLDQWVWMGVGVASQETSGNVWRHFGLSHIGGEGGGD